MHLIDDSLLFGAGTGAGTGAGSSEGAGGSGSGSDAQQQCFNSSTELAAAFSSLMQGKWRTLHIGETGQ